MPAGRCSDSTGKFQSS